MNTILCQAEQTVKQETDTLVTPQCTPQDWRDWGKQKQQQQQQQQQKIEATGLIKFIGYSPRKQMVFQHAIRIY